MVTGSGSNYDAGVEDICHGVSGISDRDHSLPQQWN